MSRAVFVVPEKILPVELQAMMGKLFAAIYSYDEVVVRRSKDGICGLSADGIIIDELKEKK